MSTDMNIYDLLYIQARSFSLTIGSKTYDEIVDNIKNNPERYPWEHSLNKYPKETIDAYWEEVNTISDSEINFESNVSWLDFIKDSNPVTIDTSKSLATLISEMTERERQKINKEKKEKQKQSKIWHKYFDIEYDGGLFVIFDLK